MYKKYGIVWIFLLLTSITWGQTRKKPTLMILPSDNWCIQRYFTITFDNQGVDVQIPNYQQAFQEDMELGAVISKVGELLTKLGYSLKDAEQEIKNVSNRIAEDYVTQSKTSNSSLAESPLDVIKRRAKADIILQLWWKVNNTNLGRAITFTLEAFDSYTSKRIATATGTGEVSNQIVPVLLEEAVKKHIKNFDKQLDKYYQDIKKNGREIVLTIKCWENWENDLETEYDNEELINCIQKWMRSNTVNGNFNLSDASENFAQFEQVRIPLEDSQGNALDARAFITVLQKYLRKAPYEIMSKVMVRGLGEAILILGEK